MLWYKAWLETRWRFLIGLALLLMSACGVVVAYPTVMKLMPLVPTETGGELGRRIREAAELASSYRGYVWAQWFSQNLMNGWLIFAVVLGTGGLLSQGTGGGALFTLSLPATRKHLVMVRAVTGLAELLVLAVVPSLVLMVISPAVGQHYSVIDALVHSTCLFLGGAVFFHLTFMLSTIFGDVWRPMLIGLGIAMALAFVDQAFLDALPIGLFRTMRAESYFRAGAVPWFGLFASLAVSAGLLAAAIKNTAAHDF